MRASHRVILPVLACLMLMATSCAKYVITQELEGPIPVTKTCKIGTIADELPSDIPEDKRPSVEDIGKLKDYLSKEFEKRDIMELQSLLATTDYKIEGSILEYKKGSGTLRFFIGFGAGNAKVLLNLKLIDLSDNSVVFGGNFSGTVSSWGESGDKIFQQAAKDFTKQLEKRLKKLRKAQGKG